MSSILNEINSMGIFYKIKDENLKTRGYIYGTSHRIEFDGDFTLNQKVKRAFERSNKLIVECNSLLAQQMSRLGSNIKEQICELKKNLDILHNNFAKELYIDLNLLIDGYDANKEIIALETPEEQKSYLELMSNPKYREISSEKYSEIGLLNRIVHKTSNEEIVERCAKFGLSKEGIKFFFDERNVKMAEIIDNNILGRIDKQFIAVGAGHLVGVTGIVNLLKEKGWILEKVED